MQFKIHPILFETVLTQFQKFYVSSPQGSRSIIWRTLYWHSAMTCMSYLCQQYLPYASYWCKTILIALYQ